MKLKHFVAKLIGLFLVLGLFTACPHPNTPEKEDPANNGTTNPSGGSSSGGSSSGGSSSGGSSGGGGGSSGGGGSQTNTSTSVTTPIATVESTNEGIKFTWANNLPSEVGIIEIHTEIDSDIYYSFIINDISSVPYVIDKNVTSGQNYRYFITTRKSNGNWLNETDWFTLKATGGNGERTFTATATSDGIKLANIKNENSGDISIYKYVNGSKNYDFLNIRQYAEDNSFTDKYVDSGTAYKYRIEERIGSTGYWENGVWVEPDDLIEYPRYKPVTVTAIGGSGKIEITNKDSLTFIYDADNESVTLNQKPNFNYETQWWRMDWNYYRPNRGNTNLANYYSSNDELTQNVNWLNAGVWLFDRCWVRIQFEDVDYQYAEYDFDDDKVTKTISYQADDLFMPIATPNTQGIKLTWQNPPQGTDRIRIYGVMQNSSYNLFEINDLSDVTEVVDTFVTSGKTYQYRIQAYDSDGDRIGESETVSAKATAGSGELELTVQAGSSGIQIAGNKQPGSSSFQIRKRIKGSNDWGDSIYLRGNSSTINFTDYWTESGTEYEYIPSERIGEESGWRNNSYQIGDDVVEYPRYKTLTVQATGGAGKLRISNSPKLTFDENEKVFKLSKKPEISGDPDSWRLGINYKQANDQYNNTWSLAWFNSGNNNLENFNNSDAPLGEWFFDYYQLEIETDDIKLYHEEKNTSDFEEFPENITLTNANMPRLTVTAATTGIKFDWSNIPENIQDMQIRLYTDDQKSITYIVINDLEETSFIAEYVDIGTKYNCQLVVQKENGQRIYSDTIAFTPSTGKGAIRITNQPAATYDNINTVTFTTDPTISVSSLTNWYCQFEYSKNQNNGGNTLYSFNAGETKPTKTISMNLENGTWSIKLYCISFITQDFQYYHNDYDTSKLSNMPQAIVISDENRFGMTATPIDTGIKLQWRNLPSNAAYVEIYTNEDYWNELFVVNNLEETTSVIDTYVTAGTEYDYKLIVRNANGNGLEGTNWITATATAGSGEKNLTATTTTSGINIAVEKPSDNKNLYFYKSIKGASSTTLSEKYNVYYRKDSQSFTDVDSIEFTDTFVTNNTEYIYLVNEGLSGPSDDDVIAFPRYKTTTVRATGGSGTPALLNEPEVAINQAANSVSFTVAPVITDITGVNGKEIIFTYSTNNGNNQRDIIFYRYGIGEEPSQAYYNSSSDNLTRSIYAYTIKINFPLVEYRLVNTDLSKLSKMPQTITFHN